MIRPLRFVPDLPCPARRKGGIYADNAGEPAKDREAGGGYKHCGGGDAPAGSWEWSLEDVPAIGRGHGEGDNARDAGSDALLDY